MADTAVRTARMRPTWSVCMSFSLPAGALFPCVSARFEKPAGMAQKNFAVRQPAAQKWIAVPSHVRVGFRQVAERIQLRHEFAVGREEHQIERILPVLEERVGEIIAFAGILLEVVDQNPGAHKMIVNEAADAGFGEQTCSQVGPAGSTALVIEGPPENN